MALQPEVHGYALGHDYDYYTLEVSLNHVFLIATPLVAILPHFVLPYRYLLQN